MPQGSVESSLAFPTQFPVLHLARQYCGQDRKADRNHQRKGGDEPQEQWNLLMPRSQRHKKRTSHRTRAPAEIEQIQRRAAPPGFTSATSKICRGNRKPQSSAIRRDAEDSQRFGPAINRADSAAISKRPSFIANRNPQRETSTPESATAQRGSQILRGKQGSGLRIVQRPARRKRGQHRTQKHGRDPNRHKST